jgi:hypothetical protein
VIFVKHFVRGEPICRQCNLGRSNSYNLQEASYTSIIYTVDSETEKIINPSYTVAKVDNFSKRIFDVFSQWR